MKSKRKRQKPDASRAKPLLQQLAAVPEKLFAGAFRQQYGAICFRFLQDRAGIEILLITSRDTGRWIIPKGWPMKGKAPCEAAEIEAWEEAGARGKASKKPVGRYTYLKLLNDGEVVPCVVDLFQIEVRKQCDNFKECGQRVVQWVSPEEAARRVREVELKSFLADFTP